jgi:hypothetical protein
MKTKIPVTYCVGVTIQAVLFAAFWCLAAIIPFVLIPLLLVHFS